MTDDRRRWRPFRRERAGPRALTLLGPDWQIVDRVTDRDFSDPVADRFLAIGPGGVYAILVVAHGRSRVILAGDVIQIEGRRPAYVAEARRTAQEVSRRLSAAVGLNVPVTAVLVLDGHGSISVHGLPRECQVASASELDRLLLAGGSRISAKTAAKLAWAARFVP